MNKAKMFKSYVLIAVIGITGSASVSADYLPPEDVEAKSRIKNKLPMLHDAVVAINKRTKELCDYETSLQEMMAKEKLLAYLLMVKKVGEDYNKGALADRAWVAALDGIECGNLDAGIEAASKVR